MQKLVVSQSDCYTMLIMGRFDGFRLFTVGVLRKTYYLDRMGSSVFSRRTGWLIQRFVSRIAL